MTAAEYVILAKSNNFLKVYVVIIYLYLVLKNYYITKKLNYILYAKATIGFKLLMKNYLNFLLNI